MPLLKRHARGVVATRAGQVLYERACEILRLVEEAERQVGAAARFEAETVVLGLTNGFLNLVGRELLRNAKLSLSGVKVGLVEERSLVMVDAIEKHEIDVALAYEVHERPNLARIALLEEDMLLLTRAGKDTGGLAGDIPFSSVVKHQLVLPGHRDGVREQLLASAKRLAVQLNIVLDVSSISMMKDMVVHGEASAVMPFGNAILELEQGLIRGQRIVEPNVKRTLYLVRSLRRAPFDHEEPLLDLIASSVREAVSRLGPLANPLPALDQPLAATLARLRSTAAIAEP